MQQQRKNIWIFLSIQSDCFIDRTTDKKCNIEHTIATDCPQESKKLMISSFLFPFEVCKFMRIDLQDVMRFDVKEKIIDFLDKSWNCLRLIQYKGCE